MMSAAPNFIVDPFSESPGTTDVLPKPFRVLPERLPTLTLEPQESQMTALELIQMVELSTAHLSLATRSWLDDPAAAAHRPTILAREYGWMITTDCLDWNDPLPPDLELCLRVARANGASWLLFDSDVDERDDLPMYDDDNTICREFPYADPDAAAAETWLPGLAAHRIITWQGEVANGWPRGPERIEVIDPRSVQETGLKVVDG